jgi:hypothetical protein
LITLAQLYGGDALNRMAMLRVEQERDKFFVTATTADHGLRSMVSVPKSVAMMFVGAIVLDVANQESEAEERRALKNPPNPS